MLLFSNKGKRESLKQSGAHDRCVSEKNYARLLSWEPRGSNEANPEEKFVSKLVWLHFTVYFKYGKHTLAQHQICVEP